LTKEECLLEQIFVIFVETGLVETR